MSRSALPWILAALAVGGWVGATLLGDRGGQPPGATPAGPTASDASSEIAALRAALEELRAEVKALRGGGRARGGAVLAGSSPSGARGRRPAEGASRGEVPERSEAFKQREARARRREASHAKRKDWWAALRSLKSKDAQAAALAEMRAAFDGKDEAARLAALGLSRWLGGIEYDHADFREGILPHARSEDPEIRRAARIALAWVQPEASDIALLVEEARTADRSSAEELTEALVRVSGGVIRGEVAEAVLDLLREGTDIKKAFVIRGLQAAKEFDPSVEARMIEVVRSVPPHDYDSGYYFHFITPQLDPKSDAVVDLMLERIGEGRSNIETIVRGFRKGLDDVQKDRVADELLTFAENAANSHSIRYLLEGLRHVAGARHVAGIEALGRLEGFPDHARRALDDAARAARTRR